MPKGQYDRKKAKQKKAEKLAKSAEPELMRLDENTVLKLEKLSNQLRAVDSETVITGNLRQSYLQKIDPEQNLLKFDQKLEALRAERQKAQVQYVGLAKSIGDRLGITLSDYSYDDETGVLRKLS